MHAAAQAHARRLSYSLEARRDSRRLFGPKSRDVLDGSGLGRATAPAHRFPRPPPRSRVFGPGPEPWERRSKGRPDGRDHEPFRGRTPPRLYRAPKRIEAYHGDAESRSSTRSLVAFSTEPAAMSRIRGESRRPRSPAISVYRRKASGRFSAIAARMAGRQRLEEGEVVPGEQHLAEDLARLDQVVQVGAGIVAAGRAVDGRVQRRRRPRRSGRSSG